MIRHTKQWLELLAESRDSTLYPHDLRMAAPPALPAGLLSPAFVDNTRSEHPLILRANEPLVVATPFMQWQVHAVAGPGVHATMSIPHSRAVKAFLRRCSLSATPADTQIFAATDCFQFFLNGDAWNRLLNEMLASGLLGAAPFVAWPTFLEALENLQLHDAAELVLTADDIDTGESFDAPAIPAAPAVPAQAARRGQPARAAIPAVDAQPAVPGPANLAFLSLYTVDLSYLPASPCPLAVWADLLGALAPQG